MITDEGLAEIRASVEYCAGRTPYGSTVIAESWQTTEALLAELDSLRAALPLPSRWIDGFTIQVHPEPDDSSWTAEVPEMPGCVAGGVDACDAVVQVADAIEAWTEADLDRAALLAPQTKEKE